MKRLAALSALLLIAFVVVAQRRGGGDAPGADPMNPLREVRWRQIGPFRGGRVIAVAGVSSLRDTYYFGGVGGGVFKTTDGGASWLPVSDGFFQTGSVGAIAIAESDPNVVYVGMGESCIRGNASHGDGVYKSTDGGRTWRNVGLQQTQHIGAVRVDPRNANVVFVAAMGHQFGPNEERGVYKSTDGGATWKQVLTRGPKAGAIDISMDARNPNLMYAAFWEVYRTPYSLESGGPGSGIWKSLDAGETWVDVTRRQVCRAGRWGASAFRFLRRIRSACTQ
jgi:photosystem II stability/assembly factor-like uncharacterized protein